ncbi:MAG TPA: polysaccharide biosynthesis tyrosine autokinase, partial [Flavisolibacter sp.]|nr:polysaccharide biosynthesis tyrosine autokinase [Flavisolibacter sp.]
INDFYVAFRKQNKLIDPTTQSAAYLTRIETDNQSLNEQKVQINNALQIQEYLTNKSLDNISVPSTLGLNDPTLTTLIEEYNKLQLEKKELTDNAPPGNVLVKQKVEQVDLARRKILENVKNIRASFNNTVGALKNNTGKAVAEISQMPSKERELLDIQRDLIAKAEIYNTLLGKREEASIALASTISNTKILQEAMPNGSPVKPNRNAVRLLALVIGILLPIAIIIIIELLNDKVTSRNDIERLTDATILGEVGHSFDTEPLVVTPGNRKVIAEQFRILRSNLQYILRNHPRPVIIVTSSFSGEGKSFISTNVGAVMALTNKKTIILEFDIRKPKVLSHLRLSKKPGLSNYLLGQLKAEDLPVQVPGYDHLFVLPCGPLPPNPSEILLDAKLNDLFVYLKENFEVIVMDTAPVGMVSDAMTLSKFADCTLYIVRQGHTYKKQIGLIDEYYHDGRLPKISIVLNDVKVRAGYGYYGYGRYGYGNGYGYGYGSGYFDDDKPSKSSNKWFGWLGSSKNGVKKKKKAKA